MNNERRCVVAETIHVIRRRERVAQYLTSVQVLRPKLLGLGHSMRGVLLQSVHTDRPYTFERDDRLELACICTENLRVS